MSTISVFINGGKLDLPAGTAVAEAVRMADATLEARMVDGTAYVTDGRGIEVAPTDTLTSGAILRVVVRARRGPDADA
jgi:hypothetical protein